MLPVIVYILSWLSRNFTPIDMNSFFTQFGFDLSNTFVYECISGAFGHSGVFPLFGNDNVLFVFVWFIDTYIAHLFVDFILFIPRLCHKWMKAFTQGDCENE